MKTQNKILVIILTIILALTMMPIVSNASTLTINNDTPTSNSSNYEVYEILKKTDNGYELTTNAEGYFKNNVTATVNDGKAQNLTSVDEVLEYLTDLASSTSTSEKENTVTYSPATKEAFATDYREKVTADRTVDTKDLNGQITNVENGYYLIYDTNGDPRSQNMLVEVTGDKEIIVKAVGITMEKQATNGDSHYIGENVEFTIKTVVPNMSGYSAYTFKITDTPTNLSIDKDTIKVVINKEVKKENSDETEIKSIDITSDLTEKITISNSVLTVDLGEYLFTNKANLTVGSEILVTYKAELTSGALDSSVATNDAKITYSNDPNKTNTGTAIPSTGTEKVYTYSITVNKKSTLGKALSGAKFVLKASDEKYIKVDSTTKAISLVDSKDDATEYTSDENGQFKIEGLKEGTYELVEKEAPEGYSIVSGLIFNIANDDNSTIGNAEPQKVIHTLSKGTNASGNIEIVESSKLEKFELNVIDSKTTILPSTGGIGTTIFTVVGIILMVSAVVAIVVINKKNNR